MDKKQLAEMIKHLRNEKLKEQKEIKAQSKEYLKKQKFNPVHAGPEGDTPNRYAHGMEEAIEMASQFGHKHRPRKNIFKGRLLPNKRGWQKVGNQSRRPKTYTTEEETEKLGSTDTKRKTQSVTITPEFEPFGKQ